MASKYSMNDRPSWPRRAIVTAGEPYGNKGLHFGHVGGVFVPADFFARFLRDRLGRENVIFTSGTDCYGSPIMESYRKLKENEGYDKSISEYVESNHSRQAATLNNYNISCDIYGSGLEPAAQIHNEVTAEIIERLHEQGTISKRSTLQFYDAKAGTFLNGRQVIGRCPIQGCKSEKAYADECDLGHQFEPEELIAPKSQLTGEVPELRPVDNLYFDLPAYLDFMKTYTAKLAQNPQVRSVVSKTVEEWLLPAQLYIQNKFREAFDAVEDQLPEHTVLEPEGNKSSFTVTFPSWKERDDAHAVLANSGVRFRSGKALVPFRITGNIEWGVRAPVIDGVEGLTVWCWPESLWAPISFTITINDEQGMPRTSWRDFWCSDDARVYQFIGQDNLYFYGVAQPALWEALRPGGLFAEGPDSQMRQTTLVANHHMLFGKKKASSSGAVKPPTGEELLEHYTPEQLRAHFLALGLDQKSVGFSPKPFDPDPAKRDDPRYADPVLKEGALLTNVFNRLARSCFYEAQKNFDGCMPLGAVTPEVRRRAFEALLDYEERMHKVELHRVMSVCDEFIRWSNKWWADGIKAAEASEDADARRQVLVDSFYLLRVACLLMHPVVPVGCEKICDYLSFDFGDFFSWNYDFDSNDELCPAIEIDAGAHRIHELPPRFDFFRKHESQYK